MSDKIENKTVLIMMATYNGEKYIREQLDSIINQSFSNWELAIQDDGSTDKTIDIIHEYMLKDKRIQMYVNDSGFHGASHNFIHLCNRYKLNNTKYNYYMFSDQDDIWLKNKIEILLRECNHIEETYKNNKPVLVYGNMQVCDKDLNIIVKDYNNIMHIDQTNHVNVFFSHNCNGCNILFNYEGFKSLPIIDLENISKYFYAHDTAYYQFCASLGYIKYVNQITLKYRRHQNNVSSKDKYIHSFPIIRYINKLFVLNKVAKVHAERYNQTIYSIKLLEQITDDKNKKTIFNQIYYFTKNGGIGAVCYMLKNGVNWYRPVENFAKYLIALTGMYKKYLCE